MQLGFVSAIFPEFGLEDVFAFAAEEGFGCVELMCWPRGGADRRYAGVTHIDVGALDDRAVARVDELRRKYGVAISALGYYPNPLSADADQRRVAADHLKQVITAAPRLGLGVVNTFIGRDPVRSIDDNWPLLRSVWADLVRHAEGAGVTLGIENCPMLFSKDEWPGGKNLAIAPAVWRRLFAEFPTDRLGLNFDPSHLIWQHIDYLRCLREFGKKIVHFHAKDARIDPDALYDHGILGLGWHTPKLPGLGDVEWGKVFSLLTDAGYDGPVCIEVEDRAYEGSLEARKRSLRQSQRFLEQWI